MYLDRTQRLCHSYSFFSELLVIERRWRTNDVKANSQHSGSANLTQPSFNCERLFAHRFAVSPLVPASGGGSSFLLASALILQQALQPAGRPCGQPIRDQGARCVRPTSAT
jgi:hypothetical protein